MSNLLELSVAISLSSKVQANEMISTLVIEVIDQSERPMKRDQALSRRGRPHIFITFCIPYGVLYHKFRRKHCFRIRTKSPTKGQ